MTRKWKRGRMVPTEREREMWRLIQGGQSFTDVGNQYDLTRERVRQIMKGCFGITGKDYPRKDVITANIIEQTISDRGELSDRKEQRYSKVFGCSVDVVTQIIGGAFVRGYGNYASPASKYYGQRSNALKRGIGWDITFPEWWHIWQESGKWPLRGRGYGYGMGRYGDSGPYKVGNVYICTGAQNASDQYLVYCKYDRAKKIQETRRRNQEHTLLAATA
jgi:hypothetical protein